MYANLDYKKNATKGEVLLSAFGIHSGGGGVLLKAVMFGLLGKVKVASLDSRFILDKALVFPEERIKFVRRSLLARIFALIRLSSMTSTRDTLLCFNSLPPFKKPKGRVIVFVQAPHFFGAIQGVRYEFKTLLRHKVEQLWFKLFIQNCDEIWVQTSTMKDLMKQLHPSATIKVVSLLDSELALRLAMPLRVEHKQMGDDSKFTFFYPADSVGHKNHLNLLKAWGLLAKQGRTPKLLLTLKPKELKVMKEAAQLDTHELESLETLGWVTREVVLDQLSKSSALIFPSKAETFGLPLLEANALGIPILASELDFVRDVCKPAQTFNPDSPRSISMAVLRFMDGDLSPQTNYYSADRFVKELLL